MTEGRRMTLIAGEALEPYRRVKMSGETFVYADAGDIEDAYTMNRAEAQGDAIEGVCRTPDGTVILTGTGAIAAGALYYGADDGKVSPTGLVPLGRAKTACGGADSIFEAIPFGGDGSFSGLVHAATAPSSAVTNTTDPTKFDTTFPIPAGALKAGDVLRISFQGIATATNGTDTLAIKLMLGSIELLALAAVDVADNNIFEGEMEVVIRTAGATGTLVARGQAAVIGAAGTSNVTSRYLGSTAVDTTEEQEVAVQATWSAASEGNSCRLDVLNVRLERKAA